MIFKTVVLNYFEELRHTVVKYGLIFNVDRKGISQDHTPPQLISGTLIYPPANTSGKPNTVTVLDCGSVIGAAGPPYFVFAGIRMLID